MPAKCSVPGCPTKAQPGSGPRFYCIPSEINFTGKASPLRVSRRKKWIAALKLQHFSDTQLKNIRICGRHFVSGKPADQYFVHHPDWIPSQNLDLKERAVSIIAKTHFLNKLHPDGPLKKQNSPLKKYSSSSSSEDASLDFNVEEVNKYSMPQKRCCVASCLNRISKTKNSSPSIFYFKFPEDALTRHRWMFLCQKKGTWDPDQCYVCSDHFLPENFISDGHLKPLSVPTNKLLCETERAEDGSVIQMEGKSGVCSIPWCKSKQSDEKHMELFPEKEESQDRWIEKIFGAKVPVVPNDKCIICSDHFAKNQFVILDSEVKRLKEDAVPSLFTISQMNAASSVRDKEKGGKRKTELSKGKESNIKNSDHGLMTKQTKSSDDDKKSLSNNNMDLNVESNSCESDKKIVKVCKVIKRQFLSDHTYSGIDSPGDEKNSNDDVCKKKKVDSSKSPSAYDVKQKSIEEITDNAKYNKDVEDLIADLLGDDGANEPYQTHKTLNNDSEEKSNLCLNTNEEVSDSLGDYSDYSETDSDSDFVKPQVTNFENMSEKDLKELAEAQKYQLEDLKSENKELIDDNEKLRKALSLIQSDPEYAHLNREKNKFLTLTAKLFRNFLNEDQILSLLKSADPSTVIAWTGETINKAIKIEQACSGSGYDLLIELGFPLPPRRLLSLIERDKPPASNADDN